MRRYFARILVIVMLLAYLAQPLSALAEDLTSNPWKEAMHFRVQPWHAANRSDDSGSDETIEGYIVPLNGGGFAVYKNTSGDVFDPSAYLPDVVEVATDGSSVTVFAREYTKSNEDGEEEPLETFAGFSVSAGHDAVTLDKEANSLTIKYNSDIHLVKSHAFFSVQAMKGHDDSSNPTEEPYFDSEHDTCKIDGTKYYNTEKGLHTDKTASVHFDENGETDGRTFDLDLEAWYAAGSTPLVGMILDASGSMAFTVGKPAKIQITDPETLSKIQNRIKAYEALNLSSLASDWEAAFLTQDELAQILNRHNTDNSRLSNSGYTYYVYDGREGTEEYVPLAYWDGTMANSNTLLPQMGKLIGKYTFSNPSGVYPDPGDTTSRTWLKNEKNGEYASIVKRINQPTVGGGVDFAPKDGMRDWGNDGSGEVPSGMSHANGWTITSSTSYGIQLDAVPSSDRFTIEFSIKRGAGDNNTNPAEILYVGSSVSNEAGAYYRGIRNDREGGDPKKTSIFRVYQHGESESETAAELDSVFGNDDRRYITLVFDNGKVTSYLDGEKQTEKSVNSPITLKDRNIIFGGILDEYDGRPLTIDDIYVYDTALEQSDVERLYQIVSNQATGTGGSTLAVTESGNVLGIIDNANAKAGWYYISHTGKWNENYANANIQTAKGLYGSPVPQAQVDYYTDINDENLNDNEKKHYIPTDYDSVRFYVNGDGYLCAFYLASASNADWKDHTSSYVYEYKDEQYIKTEALQRALGVFVTRLHETNPTSYVGAVRFSTNDSALDAPEELEKLLVLDWTQDTEEALKMLSLQRGNGGTLVSDTSEWGWEQYNYGLTGGTATIRGLQAFNATLNQPHPKDEKDPTLDPAHNDKLRKYVIIFTDGLDTVNDKRNEAVSLAQDLDKKDGYTVLGIMLNGGGLKEESDSYKEAMEFLTKLAGDKSRVSSIDLAENDQDDTGMAAVDALVAKFSQTVIRLVNVQLEGYNVQDYIDPRFDLVDVDGSVWHLNAGGAISIGEGGSAPADGTDDEGSYWVIQLASEADVKAGICEDSAREARLYYNAKNDMYFLRWVGQDILGCAEGVETLTTDNIWNARVTVRAKEDFIGGNAVLTNGQVANMNFVYHPNDPEPKSDSDSEHTCKEGKDGLEIPDKRVSKGFPRTTVNVQLPTPSGDASLVIYMGEALNTEGTIQKMVEAAVQDAISYTPTIGETEEQARLAKWYWEYLARYDAYYGTEKIKELEEKGSIELDYCYIPNLDGTNQVGSELEQRTDVLGKLRYTWTANKNDLPDEPTKDNDQRRYTLSVTYTPDDENIRKGKTNTLIKEQDDAGNGVYPWDSGYKPPVGETAKSTGEYKYTIDIVAGKIVLQMLIPAAAAQYLSANLPDDEFPIVYTAQLIRNYDVANVQNELVGTLKVTVAKEALTGEVIAMAELEPWDEYSTYVGSGKSYILPIGTYSVKWDEGNSSSSNLFSFEDIESISLMLGKDEDFTPPYPQQYGERTAPKTDFEAINNSPEDIKLGTDTTKLYTDERYALLQVTLKCPGGLSVSKTVTGNDADPTQDFAFTVTLDDTSINGTYGDMTFVNGVATFTLKHGETKTATALPKGLTYTVTESNNDGYIVSSTGDTGTITETGMAIVTFVNAKGTGDAGVGMVPPTGDSSRPMLWLSLMLVGAAGLLLRRRARR